MQLADTVVVNGIPDAEESMQKIGSGFPSTGTGGVNTGTSSESATNVRSEMGDDPAVTLGREVAVALRIERKQFGIS